MIDEERVRQLAYSIWEAEGRPEGQQQQHWDRALKIVAAEQSGYEAELEEVGEPLDETPIFEDDLPLEDDEIGIQENRLPLDDPGGTPPPDEAPFRDDTAAGQDDPVQDMPVQDRSHPSQSPTSDDMAGSMEPMPEDSAMVARARHPRRSSDTLTAADETDASQVLGKKSGRAQSQRKATTAGKADPKPAKKTTSKAKKTKPTKSSDRS